MAAITDDMELLLPDLDRVNQSTQGAEKEVALLQEMSGRRPLRTRIRSWGRRGSIV